MANTVVSPNMSLPVPVPGVDPGPDYANNLNSSLNIVDGHNHSPGSGVQITPLGLNINSNLSFANNSATNVYGVLFSSPATSSQTTFLYTAPQSGGGIYDLFYNDGAGNVIPLTKAGIVNAVASSIPGESYSGGTFTWRQGSGSTTPANFDIGLITLRPNTSGTTNGIQLQTPSGIASAYALVLPALPASTSIMRLDSSGNITASLVVDNSSIDISSNQLQVKAQGILQTMLAPRSTGSTAGVGGVAVSSGSGAFVTSSTTAVAVTNLSVTLTTSGRPVMVMLQPDPANLGSLIEVFDNGTASVGTGYVEILNGSTVINVQEIKILVGTNSGVQLAAPPSAFSCLDLSVNGSASTYTYSVKVYCFSNGTSPNIAVDNVILVAYEI